MFLGLFDKWKEILANKREFKRNSDRVCERHFESKDIVEYWENNINGIIHRTKRDKPKLRDSAIPSLHLPTWTQFTQSNDKRIEILSSTIIKKKKCVEIPKPKVIIVRPKKVTVEEPQSQMIDELIVVEDQKNLEKRAEAFENLYDEAFDVTMPNCLWGIHRDPDRKFLVFSVFNATAMKFDKYLHISDDLRSLISTNEEVRVEKLSIEKATTEFVGELLDKIEQEFS